MATVHTDTSREASAARRDARRAIRALSKELESTRIDIANHKEADGMFHDLCRDAFKREGLYRKQLEELAGDEEHPKYKHLIFVCDKQAKIGHAYLGKSKHENELINEAKDRETQILNEIASHALSLAKS